MDSSLRGEIPSSIIRRTLARNGRQSLSLEKLVASFGDQGFGFLLVMMALPLVIPLPPGVGFIPASCLMIWASQRLLGKTAPWIPRMIGRKPISPALMRRIERRGLPICERLERFCVSKRQVVLREREIRVAAFMVVFMSLLIMLPTPFLNSIPAFLTFVMGLAILGNNRLLLWTTILLALLILVAIYLGAEMLVEEFEEFFDAL